MAYVYEEASRTFGEYLLIPALTRKDCVPENVDLKTPLGRYKPGGKNSSSLKVGKRLWQIYSKGIRVWLLLHQ